MAKETEAPLCIRCNKPMQKSPTNNAFYECKGGKLFRKHPPYLISTKFSTNGSKKDLSQMNIAKR